MEVQEEQGELRAWQGRFCLLRVLGVLSLLGSGVLPRHGGLVVVLLRLQPRVIEPPLPGKIPLVQTQKHQKHIETLAVQLNRQVACIHIRTCHISVAWQAQEFLRRG